MRLVSSWRTQVDLLEGQDALPGWFGSGVPMPPGHDAYVAVQSTGKKVEHRVLATVDFRIDD